MGQKNIHNGKVNATKQKEKSDWVKQTIKFIPWISVAVFAVLAWVMLVVKNSDYLFTVQERSLFMDTEVFFDERMAVPQGWLQWVGCYLTQFFYHPMLGSAMLIGVWLLTFYLMKRTFRISGKWSSLLLIPLVALLISVIDLGYWMYYIKSPGYWFTESLGLLFTILAVWIGNSLPQNKWLRLVWIVVWTFLGYPLFGWFALLGTVLLSITGLKSDNGFQSGNLVLPIAGALSIIATPLLWYQHYTTIRIEDIYIAGFPLFNSEKVYSILPCLPFIVMAVAVVVLALLVRSERLGVRNYHSDEATGHDTTQSNKSSLITTLVVIGASVWITNTANFDNYNYHAELRMYRATDEQRWTDVLKEAADAREDHTRQMVLLKNIALMNTGEIGDKMFKYNNMGEPPYVYDSLRVHLVQTAGTMIYYQHAKANFAYRWAVENGVEFGYKVDDLKIMVRCAIVSGEPKLAAKYIDMLKKTTFHKEWAEKYDEIIRTRKDISQLPEFNKIMQLRTFTNMADGDSGLCEMYLINYFSNTMNKDSKLMQEMTLLYSLVQKDIKLFWPRFFLYATLNANQSMPIHYQEAAYLYGTLEKGTVDINKMPFDKARVINRYAQFNQISQSYLRQGLSTPQIGEAMKPMFGDTFWWFYYFCNNVKSY